MLGERKSRSTKGYSLGIVQASESGSLPRLSVYGRKGCHKEKKNMDKAENLPLPPLTSQILWSRGSTGTQHTRSNKNQ